MDVSDLFDELMEREGGNVNDPADRGGPTRFGITEAVVRAHGYRDAMSALPPEEAAAIYRRLYWLRPRFDRGCGTGAEGRRRTVRHRRHGYTTPRTWGRLKAAER